MRERSSKPLVGRLIAVGVVAFGAVACYASANVGPGDECRNYEWHGHHDVEVCHAHCNDEGCHEHCRERERWGHEHHCW